MDGLMAGLVLDQLCNVEGAEVAETIISDGSTQTLKMTGLDQIVELLGGRSGESSNDVVATCDGVADKELTTIPFNRYTCKTVHPMNKSSRSRMLVQASDLATLMVR